MVAVLAVEVGTARTVADSPRADPQSVLDSASAGARRTEAQCADRARPGLVHGTFTNAAPQSSGHRTSLKITNSSVIDLRTEACGI